MIAEQKAFLLIECRIDHSDATDAEKPFLISMRELS